MMVLLEEISVSSMVCRKGPRTAMQRWRNLFFIIPLLVVLLLWPLPGFSSPPAPVQKNDGIWEGHISNQKNAFIGVVETQKEWNNLWLTAFERPAPEMDFEKKVVACVFLGWKADWLYSIHIGEPVLRNKTWVVSYGLAEMILELARPFKASGQYAMKVLEKKNDAPMILEEDSPSRRRR